MPLFLVLKRSGRRLGSLRSPLAKIVAIDDSNDNEGSLIQLETKRELDELKKMVGEISNKLENLPATDTYSIKKAENSIFDVYVDYLTSEKIQAHSQEDSGDCI